MRCGHSEGKLWEVNRQSHCEEDGCETSCENSDTGVQRRLK